MIFYSEALQMMEEVALRHSMPLESVSLDSACHRILAQDILSSENFPSFRNSAMDGFALCAEQTKGASKDSPVSFRVTGCISAGEWGEFPQVSNELIDAVEIMTGACLTNLNHNAVVKVEDVEVTRDCLGKATEIRILKPVKCGENIREHGEIVQKGDLVIPQQIELLPEHLMALASIGRSVIPVKRIPRIGIVATGKELVNPSKKDLAPGMIRNSTAPYLVHAMRNLGASAQFYGIVGDHPSDFLAVLDQMREDQVDIIVSTGAVSMGKHDFILNALQKAVAKIHFHKVAIRPGKPILFGEFANGPVIFGTPGNPISTVVAFRFFITTYVRKIVGLPVELPIQARIVKSIKKPNGLLCFFRSRVHTDSKGSQIEVLTEQSSSNFMSLLQANAWALIPEDGNCAEEGTLLDSFSLDTQGFSFHKKLTPQKRSIRETPETRCCS